MSELMLVCFDKNHCKSHASWKRSGWFKRDESPIKKHMISVIHELLYLTLEKRVRLYLTDLFHADYRFDCELCCWIISPQGVFCVARDWRNVILKEAYMVGRLDEKCLLL